MTPEEQISLRAYLERILEERDDRYDEREKRHDERHAALLARYDAAIQSLQTSTQAAFRASEKAIEKAEGALLNRLDAVNEFRAQLSDVIGTFIPRTEVEARLRALQTAMEVMREANDKELASLRESRSLGLGSASRGTQEQTQLNWRTTVLVSVGLGLIGTAVAVVSILTR